MIETIDNLGITDTDREREKKIKNAYNELIAAPDPEGVQHAWETMRSLILERSPAQIRKMEIERGIFL